MTHPDSDTVPPGLERSCPSNDGDWFRIAPSRPGLERIEAFFSGHAFDPHRHDCYVIGFTLHGVQAFEYRGASRASLPGHMFVLHPDEKHDGRAGTASGFHYRSLYIEPSLIRDALGASRHPLPFVRDPVSTDKRLAAATRPALEDLDMPLDDLRADETVADIADALVASDPSFARRKLSPQCLRAVALARDFLDARVREPVSSRELEAATGLSRYALARHFRACLGTSPHRYLIMRRLDLVRAFVARGASLADAAFSAGFADQSHMTRQFRKAYGMPPGRWAETLS